MTKYLVGQLVKPPGEGDASGGTPTVDPWLQPPVHAQPTWALGQSLSMYIYLTSTGDIFPMNQVKKKEEGLPSVLWENITFGDWNEVRSVQFNVTMPLVSGVVLCKDRVVTDED